MAGTIAFLDQAGVGTPLWVSSANPLPVTTVSSTSTSNIATAQVTVGATATLIAAARTGRSSISVVNSSTVDVFLGGSGVTISTGLLLSGTKGASLTLAFNGALYGIVGTGTEAVSVIETF